MEEIQSLVGLTLTMSACDFTSEHTGILEADNVGFWIQGHEDDKCEWDYYYYVDSNKIIHWD